jgi:hypothetical protein
MPRRLGPMFLLAAFVAGGGCSRGSTKATASEGGEAAVAMPSYGSGPTGAPVGSLASPAVFSAHIAASRTHHQLVVAGLVAAEGVVRVMGLTAGGPAWSVDALRNVAWAADAELSLQPAADGVALVWRGLLEGKTSATLVILGPRGEPRGAPIPIGAGSCATAEGLAWLDPRGNGPIRVRARRWDEVTAHDVVTLPSDRAPTLQCGEHDAFVLAEGDDDLTAIAFSPVDGTARPDVVAIRDRDFGGDDEREHEAFTVGDDLDIVRVGAAGGVSLREISHGRASPWRRLKRTLSEDDDVVATDGDEAAIVMVLTREAVDACARVGSGSESGVQTVRAVRVDRKTGDEALMSLAPVDCDGSPGSFWIADGSRAPVVAWTHRRARPGPNVAPIDRLVYRLIQEHGPLAGHIDVEADALVDAGCDDEGCFAAALIRGPDNDGGRPEPILVIAYPQ